MLDFLLGNDFLLAVLAFGLVLIPAIIIHELGHFLAAKAVGITILEFGVGYPPRIARLFNWGETEFTLNWIPLGGFVRPLGEDMIRPVSEEETEMQRQQMMDQLEERTADAERDMQPFDPTEADYANERAALEARGFSDIKAMHEVDPWPRIVFMSAGAIANIVSALLIFMVIGLIGVEEPAGARVFLPIVPSDSMFAAAGVMDEDLIESIDGQVFAFPRDFFAYLAERDGETVTLTLRRLDVETSILVDVQVDGAEAVRLADADAQLLVTSVMEGSPAFTAGIEPGDIIIAMEGESLADADDPFEALRAINLQNEGQEITISLLRDSEQITLPITPRVNPSPTIGHLGAGIIPQFADEGGLNYAFGPDIIEYVPLALGEAVQYSVDEIGTLLGLMAELPVRLLSGQAEPEEGRIISIVGITQLGGAFLEQSIENETPILILRYIALISIALGITNLLPIPPLDGGRILFALIEVVRGRPMSPRREETALIIGLVFLLSLGVLVIINDILNPLTDLIP